MIENRKIEKHGIRHLSIDEVNRFLYYVLPLCIMFFVIAFFPGMREGEISVLKWNTFSFMDRL
jgi:integrase